MLFSLPTEVTGFLLPQVTWEFNSEVTGTLGIRLSGADTNQSAFLVRSCKSDRVIKIEELVREFLVLRFFVPHLPWEAKSVYFLRIISSTSDLLTFPE